VIFVAVLLGALRSTNDWTGLVHYPIVRVPSPYIHMKHHHFIAR
jgi:hypothetical protein